MKQELEWSVAAASGIRLRFDKVVLRVRTSLRAGMGTLMPDGATVVVTMTAPIREPAKTAAKLEEIIKSRYSPHTAQSNWAGRVSGSQVQIRLVTGCDKVGERIFLLVHNFEKDANALLDAAEKLMS